MHKGSLSVESGTGNQIIEILPFDRGEISIYIHWPFCLKKCPYCDFNSYVNNKVNYENWHNAYFNAFERQKEFFANKKIKSIFFGGGTPSLMDPQTVYEIINYFTKHNKGNIFEITLESNPSTFEIERFKDLKQAGINRLSTGIQSFFDKNLKFLGRNHNSNEAILALEESNKIFDRTSFDLIVGLPNQSLEDLKAELSIAMQYFKEHLSIYQLTIEKGTAFYKQNVPEMSDDKSSVLYEYLVEFLASKNIKQYEISNFALEGRESLHNLNYWQGGEYLGFGPNAQGRVFYNNKWFGTKEVKNPQIWLKKALTLDLNNQNMLFLNENILEEQNNRKYSNNNHSYHNTLFSEIEKIDTQARFDEIVITSLRLNQAIPVYLSQHFDSIKIKKLIEENLLYKHNNQLQTTKKGYMCLNYVINTLLV